jgi:hypothetical protein
MSTLPDLGVTGLEPLINDTIRDIVPSLETSIKWYMQSLPYIQTVKHDVDNQIMNAREMTLPTKQRTLLTKKTKNSVKERQIFGDIGSATH